MGNSELSRNSRWRDPRFEKRAHSVPISAQAELLGPESAHKAPSPECVIKGNVNRKGEQIYFRPGQLDYARVDMSANGGFVQRPKTSSGVAASGQIENADIQLPPRMRVIGGNTLDDDAIVKWAKFHKFASVFSDLDKQSTQRHLLAAAAAKYSAGVRGGPLV